MTGRLRAPRLLTEDGCITCGDVAVELDGGRGRRGARRWRSAATTPDRRETRRDRAGRRRSPRATGCSSTREPRSPTSARGCRDEVRRRVPRSRSSGGPSPARSSRWSSPGRHYKLMEVCGGHTHSIYKYGVDDLLPENVELVHGPGCPVCVIPMGRVDDGLAHRSPRERDLHLLRRHDARARAPSGTFLDAKAEGADIRMVYSPLDALRIAKANPGPRRRLLRDRLRDDRAVDGADPEAGQARGRRELPLHSATT